MNRAIALAAVVAAIGHAACGGSLTPPDGAGGMGGGAAGAGGIIIDGGGELDAIVIVDVNENCSIGAGSIPMPAQPVAGASCQYQIPTTPCPDFNPNNINVLVDLAAIPSDTSHTNGWDFTNATMTAIEIYGPKCEALENGSAASVDITYRFPIP